MRLEQGAVSVGNSGYMSKHELYGEECESFRVANKIPKLKYQCNMLDNCTSLDKSTHNRHTQYTSGST